VSPHPRPRRGRARQSSFQRRDFGACFSHFFFPPQAGRRRFSGPPREGKRASLFLYNRGFYPVFERPVDVVPVFLVYRESSSFRTIRELRTSINAGDLSSGATTPVPLLLLFLSFQQLVPMNLFGSVFISQERKKRTLSPTNKSQLVFSQPVTYSDNLFAESAGSLFLWSLHKKITFLRKDLSSVFFHLTFPL